MKHPSVFAFIRYGKLPVFVSLLLLMSFVMACEIPEGAENYQLPGYVYYSSSIVNGHKHRVAILEEDILNAPPSRDYETEMVGHSHWITLTNEEFLRLQNGVTLFIETTWDWDHSHEFTVKYYSNGSSF